MLTFIDSLLYGYHSTIEHCNINNTHKNTQLFVTIKETKHFGFTMFEHRGNYRGSMINV